MTRSFHPFPVLHTPRLELRRLLPSDAPVLFSIRADPRVNRYLDRPAPTDRTEIDRRIDELNGYAEANKSVLWALVPHGEEELIGTICLWNADDERNTIDIGFEMLPDRGGQGFMREAAVAVVRYAFDTMQVTEVQGWTHKDNLRSQRLMEALGFTRNAALEAANAAQEIEPHTVIYSLQSGDLLSK